MAKKKTAPQAQVTDPFAVETPAPAPTPTPTEAANVGNLSKSAMIREAMDTLGKNAGLKEVKEYIQQKHNTDINNALFYNLRHHMKQDKVSSSERKPRSPGRKAATTSQGTMIDAERMPGIIGSIKGFFGLFGGKEKFQELVDAID